MAIIIPFTKTFNLSEYIFFHLRAFKYQLKFWIRWQKINDTKFCRKYHLLLLFSFKYPWWVKWCLIKSNESLSFLQKLRTIFLKLLFSTHVFVGFCMYFREYIHKYIEPLRYLIFGNQIKFSYKVYILYCLNVNFLKFTLTIINYFLFIIYEFSLSKLKCILFSKTFFNYCFYISENNNNLSIIYIKDFYIRIPYKLFMYFFLYIEHFRLMKYNEYIMSHSYLTGENYILRKKYISLYYRWPSFVDVLDSSYIRGFRKSLLKRLYVLYSGDQFREIKIAYFITEIEILAILGQSFWLLYLLYKLNNFKNYIFQLNRRGIRNNLRFFIFSLIMRKDAKWRWFHSLSFETLLDFTFMAFKQIYSKPVFTLLIQSCEKKLFNWKILQSSISKEFFILDLKIFNTKIQSIWEEYYWREFFFYLRVLHFTITNIFSDFFIRVIGQLDFAYSNILYDTHVFYLRYKSEFFFKRLFYQFPLFSVTAEFLFGLDYFLWRLWYWYAQNNQTIESYLGTSCYDKLQLSRYLGMVTLFQELFVSKPPKYFRLDIFCIYLIIRDLFYNNLKKNFLILLLLFFLNINNDFFNENTKEQILYDLFNEISENMFCTIAPIGERDIDLKYITAPKLLRWSEKKKTLIKNEKKKKKTVHNFLTIHIFFFCEIFFIFGVIYYYFYKIFLYDKLQYLSTVKESLSFSIFLLTCTFLRIYPLYMVTLYIGNDAFSVNSFIWNIELFILIIVLGILLGSYDYFSNNQLPILDILPLILMCLFGLFLLLKSNNLIVLYFSIEIQSIVLYILIASKKFSLYTIEASLKYFIFSISLTLILLFGIALVYSELGTVDFIELNLIFAHSLEYSFIIKIGICFILFGLLLKLAIFPFHGWIADIYLGANLVSITFTAIVPKIVFIAVLIKFVFLFSLFQFELTIVLNVLGIISILIGTLIGLYESKILRLIAFSSMVNIGHILISVSLYSIEGIVAGCYMMLIYSVLILGIFIILMSYRSHEGWELKFITNLVEMVNGNKLMALTFALLMLSLAGIPPLAGFCGKFLFFVAILKQGEYLYAIILSILNVITAIYYLRTIRFIYFTSRKEIVNFKNLPISIVTSFCLSLIFVFNFLLFFFQAPLLSFLTNLILITFY